MTQIFVMLAIVSSLSIPEPYRLDEMDHDRYDVSTRVEYDVDVVSEVICGYAMLRGDHGECSHWCEPDRSQISASLPDRSEWSISREYCDEAARAFVFWADALDVPIADALTTAQREGNFQPYAMGRDSECGMFQQHAHYAYPEEMRYDFGCDPEMHGREACPMESRVDICRWLQDDVENQIYSGILRIATYRSRYGGTDAWICHWNAGSVCDSDSHIYASAHRTRRGEILRQLDRTRAL